VGLIVFDTVSSSQAYYILDELFIGGHLQETSKKEVLKICAAQDDMMDEGNGKKEDGKRR
jgi:AP-1 complex subunit sigma 1/2